MLALSWNLRLFGETLGGIADVFDAQRCHAIVRWIDALCAQNDSDDGGNHHSSPQPTFLFFQEVWDRSLGDALIEGLRDRFPHAEFPEDRGPGPGTLGSGLLLLSRWPLSSASLVPLPRTMDTFETLTYRAALCARAEPPLENQRQAGGCPNVKSALLVNLHLHSTGDERGARVRRAQILALSEIVEDEPSGPGVVVVMGGDWNTPDFEARFREVWEAPDIDEEEHACDRCSSSSHGIDGFLAIGSSGFGDGAVRAGRPVFPASQLSKRAQLAQLSDHLPRLERVLAEEDDAAAAAARWWCEWPSEEWTESVLRECGVPSAAESPLWTEQAREKRMDEAPSLPAMVFRAGELALEKLVFDKDKTSSSIRPAHPNQIQQK